MEGGRDGSDSASVASLAPAPHDAGEPHVGDDDVDSPTSIGSAADADASSRIFLRLFGLATTVNSRKPTKTR